MDINILNGTIISLKTAYDITKGIIGLKNSTEINAKVREIQDILFTAQNNALSAQAAQSTLIEEKRTLEEEIRRLETWNTEKQRYQLTNLWDTGVVAYALKESMSNAEPPHYICTTCYEDGRKSILNPQKRGNGRLMLFCPKCKSEFHSMCSRDLPINYI